ncbi:alternate-type signal peptide domain-containing protein [Gryllotalpicola koreensis]|uniref:Alternate-type signal peptide domain-containing protein n=1 Tax=Gryllotalpicola koreensis TaxID=993086 RepID=A0ABP8A0B2_9MICO
MNKLIKGAVTGAAGIALLLGGAGTFAAWNANTSIATGKVATGHLGVQLTPNSSASWTDLTGGGAGTPITDVNDYVFAPGDHIQLKQNVTVTAQGNNLTGKLSATIPAATDLSGLTVTASFDTSAGSKVTAHTTGGVIDYYTIDASDGAATSFVVPVTVDVTLPAASDNTTMNKSDIDLSTILISLKELAPVPAS